MQYPRLPPTKDKRIKLTPKHRARITKLYATGKHSYNSLAQLYNVSKRLIQFIIKPEKLQIQKEQYKLRRLDGRYYNKEKHKEAMRKHRKHKGKVHGWTVLHQHRKSKGWKQHKEGRCDICKSERYYKCLTAHQKRCITNI